MYTKDELKGYSGEMSYERAPRAPYRELRFQGKKGIFLFKTKYPGCSAGTCSNVMVSKPK